jgi:hypothetical protein
MRVYTKNYIGHGNKVVTKAGKELPIVKMTLSLENLQAIAHKYEGKEYVTFEVALMQKPDQFKHTHTVYTTSFEDVDDTPKEEELTPAQKGARTRAANKVKAEAELA